MNRDRLERSIRRHEGYRAEPYRDHLGLWTIGYGHLLHNDEIRGYTPRRTLGAMFDYITAPTTHAMWLKHDLAAAEKDARMYTKAFDSLSDARQEVLVEMAFQLGGPRLNGFRKLRAALESGHWVQAEAEMLDSIWARDQTPRRARELAARMLEG